MHARHVADAEIRGGGRGPLEARMPPPRDFWPPACAVSVDAERAQVDEPDRSFVVKVVFVCHLERFHDEFVRGL